MLVRSVMVGAACGLLLSCTASDSSTDPAPDDSATYPAAQLEDALPSVEQVPDGKEVVLRCPGSESCFDAENSESWSVQISMKGPVPAVDRERAKQASELDDFVVVSVDKYGGAVAAAAALKQSRERAAESEGEFSSEAEDIEGGGYTMGMTGTSTVDEATFGRWAGFVNIRNFALTNLDGSTEGRLREARVQVARGPIIVSATVAKSAETAEAGESEMLARALVSDYLARLTGD